MSSLLVWFKWRRTGKKAGKFVVQTLQQRLLKDSTAPKHDKHAAKKPIITLETRFIQALYANHIQTKKIPKKYC